MPAKGVVASNNPYGLGTAVGLNDQITLECTNNSGTFLRHGDVVCWDVNSALSAVATVAVSGAQSGTLASFTLTAGSSTAGFPAVGGLIIPTVVVGSAVAANQVPVYYSYTGIAGSTFTGVKAHVASVTNGLVTGTTIFPWPVGSIVPGAGLSGGANAPYTQPIVSLNAAPSDGGRLVTLSSTGAANDALVAGVVTLDGTAMTQAGALQPNFTGAAVPPGGAVMVCIGGIARVNIAANTVAARGILGTDVTPGAAATTATLGNVLGIALEAQSAKDANNCIRANITCG